MKVIHWILPTINIKILLLRSWRRRTKHCGASAVYIMQFIQIAWHLFARRQLKLWRYKSYRIRTGTKWNTMGIHSPNPRMTVNLDEYELNRYKRSCICIKLFRLLDKSVKKSEYWVSDIRPLILRGVMPLQAPWLVSSENRKVLCVSVVAWLYGRHLVVDRIAWIIIVFYRLIPVYTGESPITKRFVPPDTLI